MASILGRVTPRCWLALFLYGVSTPAVAGTALPISEDELSAYIRSFQSVFKSCDLQVLNQLLSPAVKILLTDNNGKIMEWSRSNYLETWDEICRAGGSPEDGFQVSNISYNTGTSTSMLKMTLTKEYVFGVIHHRHIKATIQQETTVARTPQSRLQVIRLYERARYEDLEHERQLVPWEDARPVPFFTRLQQLWLKSLLGSWFSEAAREATKKE